jgi:hypothetical protein
MKHLLIIFLLVSISAHAYSHDHVRMELKDNKRCLLSNGMPHHDVGRFPNRGNPHSLKKQTIKLCVPAKPIKNNTFTDRAHTSGATLTGLPIRPQTADWYDSTSPRGHSRNPKSRWKLEAITPYKKGFGLDANNAHVDHRGLYHYHGMNNNLLQKGYGTLIGYAADGHEIHYIGTKAQSGWILKNGKRPSSPFGRYDGTYLQDYRYDDNVGNLDRCNSGLLNDKFVYFATDTFPYFPRCHWGNVSVDFIRR